MARRIRRLVLACLLATGGLAAAGWWWARGVAGGGSLHQFAPTTVQRGAPFTVRVLASVWGAGRPAELRYSNWSLQLLVSGEPFGPAAGPTRIGRDGERLALFFDLRAPTEATAAGAELTWALQFRFDGRDRTTPGTHPIRIEDR